MIHLPITELTGVGKVLSSKLKRLGIVTVGDLLIHYPFRYEDFSNMRPISELKDGDEVTVRGVVEVIANKKSARTHIVLTEAIVTDGTDRLRVVWFRQPFITKTLQAGDTIYLSGVLSSDYFGTQMKNPIYEKEKNTDSTHTARIVPIYSLTSGINQKQLRNLVKQALGSVRDMDDWLPEDLLVRVDAMSLGEAIQQIHFPDDVYSLKKAQNRIKFDEIFILQLRAEMSRRSLSRVEAPKIIFYKEETKKFVESLGFSLTNAQRVSAWEILRDMDDNRPMNRLLEGDVGSGKTVVAAIALYNVVLNQRQGVLMVPTEILAKQHYESLKKLFDGLSVRISLLTRSYACGVTDSDITLSKAKQKRMIIDEIARGGTDIIVGTHALLTEDVKFCELGLVIVDEQHRFGVKQRQIIKDKSVGVDTSPHFLSMSATPIPRSFALTLYGDLDLSIIDEMPTGRRTVHTTVVDVNGRSSAYGIIRDEVRAGRQVFVVCPRIDVEGGVGGDKKTVVDEYEKLNTEIFPDLSVAYIHGKMKAKDRQAVMDSFADGVVDILIATSVIEVGVDIPNATVMMIEDAERFGLAQLHQFRGRVGRSHHHAYCLLFTGSVSHDVEERLGYFSTHASGFDVAEYDLEARGPGQVYGVEQSGMMNFRLASMRDTDIIHKARELAKSIDFTHYPSLVVKVSEWEESVHLE